MRLENSTYTRSAESRSAEAYTQNLRRFPRNPPGTSSTTQNNERLRLHSYFSRLFTLLIMLRLRPADSLPPSSLSRRLFPESGTKNVSLIVPETVSADGRPTDRLGLATVPIPDPSRNVLRVAHGLLRSFPGRFTTADGLPLC